MKNKTKFKNIEATTAETTSWIKNISFTIGKKEYEGTLWWNGLDDMYGFESDDDNDPNLSQKDFIELTKLTADG